MSMDIETLKRIGTDVDGPVRRTGSGKKQGSGNKLTRAEPCPCHGSRYCVEVCRGHATCKKNMWKMKEIMGMTLVQSWMGIATTHPDWVGKWKTL